VCTPVQRRVPAISSSLSFSLAEAGACAMPGAGVPAAAAAVTPSAKRAATKKGGKPPQESKNKRGRKPSTKATSAKRTLDAWIVRDSHTSSSERAPLRSLSPDVPIDKEVPARRGRQAESA
ncbi:unnamed protein product, partial [Scytosiphon promiscuus]